MRIVTLSEGDVTHLHVGLKGTMNALLLKDLADKTRRGLRGRVEDGKSGGGLCFGYDVVRSSSRQMANRSAAIERSTRRKLPSCAVSSQTILPASRRSPLN
ncbi:hypothetical protein [Bradyrhizobium sp. S3.2.6]|uniref:hypothetical protein n=1 Tax=Bradyrhizobium sp. S3.2.6 TaxID=3156428 RepID=UPI003396282A